MAGDSDTLANGVVHHEPAALVLRDLHRVGGGSVVNLRLKPREATLEIPGISILRTPTPGETATQMRLAFPRARDLIRLCSVIGSTNEDLIRAAGFDVLFAPSTTLPNHYRIIHPGGIAGFADENLAALAQAFFNTTGH